MTCVLGVPTCWVSLRLDARPESMGMLMSFSYRRARSTDVSVIHRTHYPTHVGGLGGYMYKFYFSDLDRPLHCAAQ